MATFCAGQKLARVSEFCCCVSAEGVTCGFEKPPKFLPVLFYDSHSPHRCDPLWAVIATLDLGGVETQFILVRNGAPDEKLLKVPCAFRLQRQADKSACPGLAGCNGGSTALSQPDFHGVAAPIGSPCLESLLESVFPPGGPGSGRAADEHNIKLTLHYIKLSIILI